MPDIFFDHKLVFMHNPKCGSRNLRAIARQLLQTHPSAYIGGMNDNKLQVVSKKMQARVMNNVLKEPVPKHLDYTWEHCSVLGIFELFKRFKVNPEGFRFLYVIRHPQDRLVSGYRYDLKREFIDPNTTFSDYIFNNDSITGAMPLNTHPIERFSLGPDGQNYIDHVITLENFESGMRSALTELGFDTSAVNFDAWRHSSADFKIPTRLTYSEEELEFVQDLWAEDFKLGNYQIKHDYSL